MPILIAEDNNAQRRYLSELLTREFPAHAPVIEAADGENALQLTLEITRIYKNPRRSFVET